METTAELAERVGIAPACEALAVSRSTFYRYSNPMHTVDPVRPRSHRMLSEAERQQVLNVLHSDRFADKSPAQVYAILLDEGIYYCSIRTMYRIPLRDNIGETIPLAVISVEGRGGFTDESTTVQERAGGNGGSP